MASTIEQAVAEYLGQKERRETITLDAEGKYKGFPVEEIKATIVDLFSELGDVYDMSPFELRECLPSRYPKSLVPAIQSLNIQQKKLNYRTLEAYLDVNFLSSKSIPPIAYVPSGYPESLVSSIQNLGIQQEGSRYGNLEIILNNDFQISSEALISQKHLYSLGNSNKLRKASVIVNAFKSTVKELNQITGDQNIIDIFNASKQFLLDRLKQLPEDGLEYKQIIQQMASSLGNCYTPVTQLLFSVATQLPSEIRVNLSSSKLEEIQQRVAFRYAIMRELRTQISSHKDSAEYVERLSDFLFLRGAYNFNLNASSGVMLPENISVLTDLKSLGFIDKEREVNVRKLYDFIKCDLLGLQQHTDKETLLFNNALDRVQKAVFKEIQANRNTFSLEYLKPINQQFYLINPEKIAEHFESKFRVWSNGLRFSSLNERTVEGFTKNYIKQRLKEIKGFIKNQPQETAFETAMTTSRASLNPNVSTSGGGSAQALPGLSLNQAQGGGRNIRRGLS